MRRSERLTYETLVALGKDVHPMSVSGGWFSAIVIAKFAGIDRGTATLRLRELEMRGLVAQSGRHPNIVWRAR